MKRLVFLSILLLSIITAKSQGFVGAGYLPKPCTENDSIKIIDTLEMEKLRIYTRAVSFELSNDSILIHELFTFECSWLGYIPKSYSIPIGKLPKGLYTVVIDGSYRKDSACYDPRDTFLNKVSFKMEVLAAPNGILEQTLSPTHLQSTLIQNQLILQALPAHSNIHVYDIQGRQCYRKENENGEASIDASGWSSGIYVISVQVGNERRRWKVVKE